MIVAPRKGCSRKCLPVYTLLFLSLAACLLAFPFATLVAAADGGGPSLEELRRESAAISAQLDSQLVQLERTDPLYAEARRRGELNSQQRNLAREQETGNWIKKNAMTDKDAATIKSLMAACTLLEATRMLHDPIEALLLREAIFGRSTLDRTELDGDDIPQIFASELTTLRDELVRQFPNITRKDVDTPAKFWRVLSCQGPLIEKSVADEAARLAAATGWPKDVTDDLASVAEHYLHNRVYVFYTRANTPRSFGELMRKRAAIDNSIKE